MRSASTNDASADRRRRSSWPSLLAWLICIAVTVASLRNTFGAEPDLEAKAHAAACAGSAPISSSPPPGKRAPEQTAPPARCGLQTTRWEANPLWRAFELVRPGGARVRVQCWREHIAIGDYTCKIAP